MKKITFLLLFITSVISAQVNLQDFAAAQNTAAQDIYGGFGGGLAASLDAAPDNAANQVGKIDLTAGGDVWKGIFVRPQSYYIDLTTTKTVSVNVHSTTPLYLKGKIQASTSAQGDIELPSAEAHTGSGWQTLTFTFTGATGEWNEFVLFANVDSAGSFIDPAVLATTVYIDDITAVQGSAIPAPPAGPTVAAPTPPARDPLDVISIFADPAYSNIANVDYNPNWGQSGFGSADSAYDVASTGDLAIHYPSFNYQGIDFNGAQDISAMEYLHVDIWTAGTVAPNVYVISSGAEIAHPIPNVDGSWQSLDIPVAGITGDLTSAIQFKFDGGSGTDIIYVDNLYFWKDPAAAGTDATLSDLQVDNATVAGFSANTETYTVDLPAGTTVVPQVTLATTTDAAATVTTITQAPAIPGDATVLVTAADGTTTKTYTISFAITTPGMDAPTPPARDAADVISIFSDAYANVSNVDYNPNWGQTGFGSANTAFEVVPGSGNASLEYPNFNYQGIDFNGAQDISAMDYLHLDIWTNDTNPNVYVISSGAEIAHPITSQAGTWQSVEIPIAGITGDPTAAIQFKFDGGSGARLMMNVDNKIYIDNLYFYKGAPLSTDQFDVVQFNVYPNPSTNNWNVKASELVNTVEVFDVLGKSVLVKNVNSSDFVIETSNLNAGLYFARFNSENGTKTVKLIKE
ncbi:T9SS type A sorting domain-containing protein [Olleya sp. R77988]|uniref:T9SS type A sorting domain-containing protein n=1 Tax=Olleya sp. R77988 TaxID=3093875 RepID=UPI0037CC9FFD